MNNIMKYIQEHKDWELSLSSPPYNLIIKTDIDYPNIYLFKYDQFSSDMNNIICQEARGIILEIIWPKVNLLCHSFDKFFNYTEDQGKKVLDNFNWSFYSFQEKRDGSLMRLWYYKPFKKWCISTSGTIDAMKASIQIPSCPWHSFGEMFEHILYLDKIDLDNLNKNYTYSFEMTSPDNKIVVDYTKDELTLIGVRDNIKNIELNPYTHNPFNKIKNAKRWVYKSLDEALKVINKKHNFEGLVLCDSNYNRVKIKTNEYLELAKTIDELSSDRGILKLILEDKIDDINIPSSYIEKKINIIKDFIRSEIESIFILYQQIDFTQDRKKIALQLKGNPYSLFVFRRLDNPSYDFVDDYFKVDNLEKIYRTYKDKTNLKN